jgi:sarcosine oxidase
VSFDVIVVGVGGHGAAALAHIARRGLKVLGLERFGIPHAQGSSHGLNRLLRVAYGEGAIYVPIVRRARELWLELSRAAGEELFVPTGSLDVGYPDRLTVPRALASCRAHGLAHDMMDAAETMRRFPGWRLDADQVALFQPDGGLVRTERSILAHARLALAAGAEIRANTPVSRIEEMIGGGARVVTSRGVFEAGQVVVSAGAYLPRLVPALARISEVRRIPVGWFAPRDPALYAPDRFPVWTLDSPLGEFYGVPLDQGHPGVKLGGPSSGDQPGRWIADPETVDRRPTPVDEAPLAAALARHLPGAAGPALDVQSGLITWTPDGHFVIDRAPGQPSTLVVSACSGHGFKFTPVIGEIVADLIAGARPRHDLAPFRLSRFEAFA